MVNTESPTASVRYVSIPEWLIDAGVTGNALKVFAVLAAKYADPETGEVQRSRWLIARDAHLGVTTVDGALSELKAIGAVTIRHCSYLPNIYHLHFSPPRAEG